MLGSYQFGGGYSIGAKYVEKFDRRGSAYRAGEHRRSFGFGYLETKEGYRFPLVIRERHRFLTSAVIDLVAHHIRTMLD
jgi:hypothetical protein